jgi:hypothetical protein
MNKALRILGIILIALSLLLLIVVPPAGVIGIIFGILCIKKSKKNSPDTVISSFIKKAKEEKPTTEKAFGWVGPVTYTEREIPDDSEEAQQIKAKQNLEKTEIRTGIIQDLKSSSFFKGEYIQEIIDRIVKTEIYSHEIFSYDICLTSEEKKKLGLPVRQKISKEMAEFMTKHGLQQEDPKGVIENIYYQNYHKVARKHELERMKKMGIKKVKIEDCGDERDCKAIKRLKKIWPIDEVPDLPLPSCTAAYCRCTYISS